MKFAFSVLASSFAIAAAQEMSLYETVAGNAELATLATAIGLAGLEGYFTNTSDLTLLAPSNAAFGTLPAKFLTPGFLPHLKYLVEYHVIEGTVIPLSNFTDGMVITMKNGEDITAAVTNQQVLFSGTVFQNSQLLIWDVISTNGIHHVIGGYLLPELLTIDLLTLAGSQEGFGNVMSLIAVSGLEEELKADNITILAPSNTAFEALPAEFLQEVAADTEVLANLLRYHVISGSYPAAMITDGLEVMTISGVPLTFAVVGGGRFAEISAVGPTNNATVEISDIFGANGISHTVSAVLEPPTGANPTPVEPTTPTPVAPTMPTAPIPVAPTTPTAPIPVAPTDPTTPSVPTPAAEPTEVPPTPVTPPTSSSASMMFGGVVAAAVSVAAVLL